MTALIELLLFVKSGAFPDRAEATADPELGSRTIDQVNDYTANGRNKGGNCDNHQSERDRSLILFV
jgi:hypothetical protein